MSRRVRLDTSLEAVVERCARMTHDAVLVTIVGTAGSTYRKAGARMLIEPDGRLTGLLSGGCFEEDLKSHAAAVLAGGPPRVVQYDMRTDDDLVFGIGAGCEGALRLLLEPLQPGGEAFHAVQTAARSSALGRTVALAMVHTGTGRLGTGLWSPERSTTRDAWIQALEPVPRILICGAGSDVEPLAAGLRDLRWQATIVDHRPAYLDPSRFAAELVHTPAQGLAETVDLARYTAAVVMSHHLVSDAAYLRSLARSDVPYVGLLGPRQRRDKLLSELGSLAPLLARRLRGPVGMDIGAATPEGIALSIIAELHGFAATLSPPPGADAEVIGRLPSPPFSATTPQCKIGTRWTTPS